MTEIVIRNVDIIAAEIISIENQTRNIVLSSAIEVGTRLLEVKEQIPHGQWGIWLQENLNYSQSKANSLMQVSREYGGNSQALGNIGFTQAVALLALPEEEREQFVEDNEVESMTTRELAQAVKDIQLLRKQIQDNEEAAEAERYAADELTITANELLEKKIESHNNLVEQLNKELKDAKAAGENGTAKKLKDSLTQATKDHKEAIKKVKELEDQLKAKVAEPTNDIPEETKLELDKLRQRESELSELTKRLEDDANKQVAELQEQIRKNNNKAGGVVSANFKSLEYSFITLIASISEIENMEQQTAVKAKISELCDEMKGKL